MKADTLRELSPDELEAKSDELREQLFKLRFQQTTGQIESPQMLRGVRKDIARVMTILREKELGLTGPLVTVEAQTADPEKANDTEDGTG